MRGAESLSSRVFGPLVLALLLLLLLLLAPPAGPGLAMEVGNVSLVPAGAGLPVLAETRLVSNGMPVGRPDIQGRRLVYDQGVWNGNSATGPYQVYSMDMDSGSTTLLSSGLTASQWMPRLYGPNTIWLDWGGKRVMRHNPGEVPPISTVAGYVEPAATAAIYGGYVAYLSTANGARKVRLRDLSTDQDVVVDGANPGYIEDAPSLADGLIAFQQRASESAPSHVRLFSFSVAGGILSTRPVFNSGTLYPSSHQVKPQLSGRVGDWTLVWLDYVANDAADLYGYRQSVGRFPIMVGQGALENPALQGDLAVWQKPKEGGLYDLYGYSISRGQLFPVATGPGSRSNPRVDGDRVVWMDTRSGKPEIYMASVQWVEATSTPAPTPSPTATPLTTATATATSTPYFTSTPSSTPSATPTAIPTDTPSPTASPTSTPLPTDTPSPTASPTFTPLPTNTPSPAPTSTPTGTPTHVPTATSTPTAALGPATAGRYGDDDPRVRYGEGWSVWVGEGPEGGSDHRSELVGSSLWFSFVGSTVALISAVGPDEGIAEVLIDGVFQPEAILHADSPRWQQAITYQVSPGEHTLLVMVSSSAWMGSPSHRVSIDGFLVDQSPTPTTSPVATATPTETLTPIPTATRTVTSTPTSTATSTPTPTSPATLTPTSTPTSTATPTSVPTSTPTVAPSLSPTPNPAATPTGTSSPLSLGFIDGTVRLQARADASGVRVTARLGDQAVQTTPSAAGSYSLRVAPGTYQVRASHRGYLTAIRDGVSVTAGKTATMAPLTLMSGELSEEMSSAGVVDAADLAFVERYYGQRPAAELVGEAADADINRDGVVDLYDLVAVTSNWLKLGSDYGW